MKQRYRCFWLIVFLVLFYSDKVYGQYKYGTTGLLQMPTAEMQRDKTFMFGVGALSPQIIPSKEWWGNYYTLNYYVNITIFPWLEIGYNCALVKAKSGIYHWVPSTYGKFVNQDRSFHIRLRVWKEGWWKNWTPQVVIGTNDPTTGSWEGGVSSDEEQYNGFFCRYYIALTKHLPIKNIGELGLHTAYVYNRRKDYPLNGPALGTNFRFQLPGNQPLTKVVNNLNLMAEYDSRTINLGAEYSFWKDYINAVIEFNRCRYFSAGLIFKIHLK